MGTLLIVVVVVGLLLWGTNGWSSLLDFSGARAGAGHATPGSSWPPPPHDTANQRLAPAVVASTSGAHLFQERRPDGSPVGYDPCRPLHYVVNPARMPGQGLTMIREAVARVSVATGLVIVEDGLTDEALAADRSPYQEDRYGDHWAPVLIGWSDETSLPLLGGEVAGFGGSHHIATTGPGSERLVSGQIALDLDAFNAELARPGGYESARAIVMHELGHVVGLAHVDDPTELMYASQLDQVEFGPGDLEGLAAVGSGPCFSDT